MLFGVSYIFSEVVSELGEARCLVEIVRSIWKRAEICLSLVSRGFFLVVERSCTETQDEGTMFAEIGLPVEMW